jgi:hypothetical protein
MDDTEEREPKIKQKHEIDETPRPTTRRQGRNAETSERQGTRNPRYRLGDIRRA